MKPTVAFGARSLSTGRSVPMELEKQYEETL